MKSTRLLLLLGFIGTISLTFASLILATSPKSEGYEVSIYDFFPWYFWILLCLTSSIGLLILFYAGFGNPTAPSISGLGLSLIVLVNIIVIALPMIHGYAMYPQGDEPTHVGLMNDIVNNHKVDSGDFYPSFHLQGASLIMLSGVDNIGITTVMPISGYLLYLFGIMIIVRTGNGRNDQRLLILAFGAPLVFSFLNVLIHPSVLAIMAMPLVLYLFQRTGTPTGSRTKYLIAFLLVVVFLVFAHPLTYIFLILVVVAYAASKNRFVRGRDEKRDNRTKSRMDARLTLNIPFLMIVLFANWYFGFAVINQNLKNAINFLLYGSSRTIFSDQTSKLSNFSMSESVLLFANRYGGIAIYLSLALLMIIAVLFARYHRRREIQEHLYVYSMIMILGIVFSTFSVLGYTGEFNLTRTSRFFIVACPIFLGLGSSYVLAANGPARDRGRVVLVAALVASVLIASCINTLNVHGSQRTFEPNGQISDTDIEGARWLGRNMNRTLSVAVAYTQIDRLEDLVFGFSISMSRQWVDSANPLLKIPSHFNYPVNAQLSESFGSDKPYIVLSMVDRQSPTILPEGKVANVPIFTSADYKSLANDTTANLIYSNGDLEILKVL